MIDEELLDMDIDVLEMPTRAFNCLTRNNINTVRQLTFCSMADLLRFNNLGRITLKDIQNALSEHCLTLRDDTESKIHIELRQRAKPLGIVQDTRKTLRDDQGEFLTIDEIAARLKVKKSFFYQPYHRKGPGAIPCLKVGKYIRYRMPDVMMWIERQNQSGAASL